MKESRRSDGRFPLQCPALIRWHVGRTVRTIRTNIKNISRSGLYILLSKGQQPPSSVEFEVELPPPISGVPGALLWGKGHLIRKEALGDQISGFAVAIDRYQIRTTLKGRNI